MKFSQVFSRRTLPRRPIGLPIGCTALFVTAGLAAGCSDGRPPRVPVAGQVTIDGQPLPNAMLAFYPPTGRPSHATTDSSGRFVLECFGDNDGAQLGTHQVTVTAVEQLDPTTMKWFAPKKYAHHGTSSLQFQIDEPIDDLHIELTWNGGKPFVEKAGSGGD